MRHLFFIIVLIICIIIPVGFSVAKGKCSLIKDSDLRNYCNGNCSLIGDNDLRNFCSGNCSSIDDNDMRYLCESDVSFPAAR